MKVGIGCSQLVWYCPRLTEVVRVMPIYSSGGVPRGSSVVTGSFVCGCGEDFWLFQRFDLTSKVLCWSTSSTEEIRVPL